MNQLKNTKELNKLLGDLSNKNAKNYEYELHEIDQIANAILSFIPYYHGEGSTPIAKIVKEFGIKPYKSILEPYQSGDISINGNTHQNYGHDKIILVNVEDELFHQRFVIAHEFAHYLFDFLGNSKYTNKNIQFSDTYYRDSHESIQERRANRFAASILMPKELFLKQYKLAKSIDDSEFFILEYLSGFFETTARSIRRRILEVVLCE